MVVKVPDELATRLAAAAAARGVEPEQVAVEAIEAQLGLTDALEAFIGSGDSGDPSWASRDIHELRADLAARHRAEGS